MTRLSVNQRLVLTVVISEGDPTFAQIKSETGLSSSRLNVTLLSLRNRGLVRAIVTDGETRIYPTRHAHTDQETNA